MKRNTYRIPLGFLFGALYLFRADPSIASFLTGAVIMVAGESIRFLSAGTLIKFEGVTNNGIYAFTRNPLYIGSFLIGAGACIMGRDVLFTALFITGYLLVYRRIILREEQYLIRRYGVEYERYVDEVPRIFPRRFDLKQVLGESAAFLAVKNRELLTVLGITAVWIIMAVKIIAR